MLCFRLRARWRCEFCGALLIHGEKPGAWALVGGLLILGATVLKSALGRPISD